MVLCGREDRYFVVGWDFLPFILPQRFIRDKQAGRISGPEDPLTLGGLHYSEPVYPDSRGFAGDPMVFTYGDQITG